MKRFALLPVLLLVFGGLGTPASADEGEGWTASGTILLPNPGSRTVFAATETLSPCMGTVDEDVPPGIAQGVDGYWVELPEGAEGFAATLTADGMNEVDAWFYDEFCTLIKPADDENAYSMNGFGSDFPTGDKEGVIPEWAVYAAVDLYVGAAATFTFTIPGYTAPE